MVVIVSADAPTAVACLGDVEIVVVVVDAVLGRSNTSAEVPILPRFRIRCRISSKVSQTVDGAVVETVDSVSPA